MKMAVSRQSLNKEEERSMDAELMKRTDNKVEIKWSDLESILVHLKSGHLTLLGILDAEKVALLDNDTSKILEILEEKESQLGRLEQLEIERLQICQKIATSLGLEAPLEVKLLTLAQYHPNGSKLRSAHAELSKLIQTLTARNQENSLYAHSALRTVESALDGIKDSVNGKKVYGQKGRYNTGLSKSGHFVSREV